MRLSKLQHRGAQHERGAGNAPQHNQVGQFFRKLFNRSISVKLRVTNGTDGHENIVFEKKIKMKLGKDVLSGIENGGKGNYEVEIKQDQKLKAPFITGVKLSNGVYLKEDGKLLFDSEHPQAKERFGDELKHFENDPNLTNLSFAKDGKNYVIRRELGKDNTEKLDIYEGKGTGFSVYILVDGSKKALAAVIHLDGTMSFLGMDEIKVTKLLKNATLVIAYEDATAEIPCPKDLQKEKREGRILTSNFVLYYGEGGVFPLLPDINIYELPNVNLYNSIVTQYTREREGIDIIPQSTTVFSIPALLFMTSAASAGERVLQGEFEGSWEGEWDGSVYPREGKDQNGEGEEGDVSSYEYNGHHDSHLYKRNSLPQEHNSFLVELPDGTLLFHFNRDGLIYAEKVENGNGAKVDQRIPNEERLDTRLHNREGLPYEQELRNENEMKEQAPSKTWMRESIRPLLVEGVAQQNNRFLTVQCLAESNMRISSGYRSMEKQNAVQAKPLQTAPIKVDEYKKEHARRPIMKPIILNGVENCPIIIVQKRRRVKAVDEKQMAAMLPPPDGGDEQENNPAPQRGELIVRDIQTAEELPVIIINERAVKSKKKKSEDELVAVDDLGESDEAHSDDLQRKRVAKFCGEAANEETEQAASSLSATEA